METFPRPGVTVDLAVLTVLDASTDPELRLVVQQREDPPGTALPGGFIRERATVAETVADVLRRKLGLSGPLPTPRLLRVFDDPRRDTRSWVLSVAHALSLPEDRLVDVPGRLVPLTATGGLADGTSLLFDHDEIVAAALADVRERYEIRRRYVDVHPDPDHFLAEPFTLHQLRRVHEAVVGEELHKDNFARRMKPHLTPVTEGGEVARASNLRGRPAALWRRLYPAHPGLARRGA